MHMGSNNANRSLSTLIVPIFGTGESESENKTMEEEGLFKLMRFSFIIGRERMGVDPLSTVLNAWHQDILLEIVGNVLLINLGPCLTCKSIT